MEVQFTLLIFPYRLAPSEVLDSILGIGDSSRIFNLCPVN